MVVRIEFLKLDQAPPHTPPHTQGLRKHWAGSHLGCTIPKHPPLWSCLHSQQFLSPAGQGESAWAWKQAQGFPGEQGGGQHRTLCCVDRSHWDVDPQTPCKKAKNQLEEQTSVCKGRSSAGAQKNQSGVIQRRMSTLTEGRQ